MNSYDELIKIYKEGKDKLEGIKPIPLDSIEELCSGSHGGLRFELAGRDKATLTVCDGLRHYVTYNLDKWSWEDIETSLNLREIPVMFLWLGEVDG